MPLDNQDIADFLNATGAKSECPVCGTDNWGVIDKLGMISVLEEQEPPTTKQVPLLILICDNCGFVRIHSASVYHQWKQNRHSSESTSK